MSTKRRIDTARHHPQIHHAGRRGWAWTCSCGGASCRTGQAPCSWRRALAQALNHATLLAA
jgi:hypothetical protein